MHSVAPLPDEYRIAISLFLWLRSMCTVFGSCADVFAAGYFRCVPDWLLGFRVYLRLGGFWRYLGDLFAPPDTI